MRFKKDKKIKKIRVVVILKSIVHLVNNQVLESVLKKKICCYYIVQDFSDFSIDDSYVPLDIE